MERFDIVLNRVEEGFMSNWLCDIEVGTLVTFHGPHGLFVMREPKHDAVFIATGTGIAPFRSMVQWLFAEPERNQDRQHLAGFRNPLRAWYLLQGRVRADPSRAS